MSLFFIPFEAMNHDHKRDLILCIRWSVNPEVQPDAVIENIYSSRIPQNTVSFVPFGRAVLFYHFIVPSTILILTITFARFILRDDTNMKQNRRRIMIKGIAHSAVTVKNMNESIRFYTKALGFHQAFELKNPETDAPWIVYLSICPGQFLELFYGGETDNPWNDRLIGFNHLCLEADDIFAAVKNVRGSGYPIDIEPKQGSDFNWQAWITDPNGIRIELMQIMPDSPQAGYVFRG